jgi:ligand-binding sensor domain-containing protein
MKKITSLTIFTLLFAVICPASSGNIPNLKKEYVVHSYTSDNGLPVNSIRAISQTPEGFIWLATEEGIVRFDGMAFTTFNPGNTAAFSDRDAYSLHLFRDSSMVTGFYHGDIVGYKKLRFYRLFDRELNWIKCILAIADDPSGGLWFGTDGMGLGHLGSDGKMKFLTDKDGLPNDFVQVLLADRDSSLWIGTRFGLCHLSSGKIRVYSTGDGLSDNDIRSLCFDDDGKLWIGTNAGGINIMDRDKISRLVIPGGPAGDMILSLLKDDEGSIWAGTNRGLFRFADGKISGMNSSEGLSGNIITCLYQDRERTIWAGTGGAGLNALHRRSVSMITEDEGLSDHSMGPVCKGPEGSIFAGTAKGAVSMISSSGVIKLEKKIGLPQVPVTTLAYDSSGTLWVGTAGAGLFGFITGRTVHMTTRDGLASDVINAVYPARNGKLWIGAGSSGINVLDNGKVGLLNTRTGLSHDQVLCFLEDQSGRIWAGTNGGGINIISPGKITWLTTETGLPDNVILSMHEDEAGIVWAGCAHGGLVMFVNDSSFFFNPGDGLYTDGILQILEDRDGRFWMSSNKGIFSIGRNELIAYHDNLNDSLYCTVFGRPEGLFTPECSGRVFPAGCIDSRNRVWFPTPGGLAELDAGKLSPLESTYSICLTHVKVNDCEVDPVSLLVLDPGKADLEFEFTSPSFVNPGQIRFRYMLDGLDNFWTDAGTNRQALYSNVPPGKYGFRVMVSGPGGRWSPGRELFRLIIRPHFYRTYWFILPMIFILITAGGFISLNLIRRSKKQSGLTG